MDLGISGRGAAVAAASSGLGYATAEALAANGVRVAICGRDQQRLDGAVESLRAGGGEVVGIRCDVSGLEGGRGFVIEAIERLGGVDILVANAGGPPAGGFGSTASEEYAKAFELNALSTVGMCEAAVPAMREAGSPSRAIVMRSGADAEMTSGLGGPETDVIKQAPGIARDGQTAVASAELFVIIDLPPVNRYADASILAPKVDGVILVVEADRTPVVDAESAKKSLDRVGARIFGVVLNRRRSYVPAAVQALL